jgi:hypothetical protein
MNNELERIRKEVAMAYCSYYLGICQEGLMNTTTNLGQETRCLLPIFEPSTI